MQKIVEMKFGSHLYGLDTPNSDTDYKAIFIPSVRDLVFDPVHNITTSTGGCGKNTKDDTDIELISIQKFVKDALNGQTYTIDMLHCENPILTSPEWEFLVKNRKKFYTKNMTAYMGYVKQQAAKYGIKGSRLGDIQQSIWSLEEFSPDKTIAEAAPYLWEGQYAKFVTVFNPKTKVEERYYEVNSKKYGFSNTCGYAAERLQKMYDSYGDRAKLAMRNEGVDWKALSHAFRAGYQMQGILEDGDFSYPLLQNEYIMAVKQGKVDFKEAASELERLVDHLNILSENSNLPDKADKEFFYDFIYSEVYKCKI